MRDTSRRAERKDARGWVALTLATALAACVAEDTRVCGELVCPDTQMCAPSGNECVDPGRVTTCEGKAEGDACVLDGIGSGTCSGGVCRITGCGDTNVDPGEQCDDGNDTDDDACTNTCTLPVCGDGVRQGDEACDDGAANGDDRACTSACAQATCGDGLVRAGVEACDLGAGNADTGACTLACAANVCGDGKHLLGVEGCDDGNDVDDDACRDSCAVPTCGDGVVQAGEACDDGAGIGDDRACTATCQANVCGDGKLHLGVEACDAGAANADDSACTLLCEPATCGDGNLWDGVEPCDDGNAASGDGCRGDCRKVEACGDGAVDAGEACDDGPTGLANPADGCDACVATAWQASAVLGREQLGTEVGLYSPIDVAFDPSGNLFIADQSNHRIRRVAAGTGVVSTVAGTGMAGFSGDGGAATSAQLDHPSGIALDGAGNLFIADTGNSRVRRVAAGTGVISTVAGTGSPGSVGDGGAATSAELHQPVDVAVDGAGNLLIAEREGHRVRRVAAGTGLISTIAGTGEYGFSGDGGPATSARLLSPWGLTLDSAGNVFIADGGNHRVRHVAAGTGVITTVVGTGIEGFSGDGGAATGARLASPIGVMVDDAGNLFVADQYNQRIRRVAAGTGVITTVAGSTTEYGFSGDDGPATAARLSYPSGVAVDRDGQLWIADRANERIRRVAAGVISTVVGTGVQGASGDGGLATSARLYRPGGVAFDRLGGVFIADTFNNRVRRRAADTGILTTVAGTGVWGFSGDDGPAAGAQLNGPSDVAVDDAGNLFIADRMNHRIRRVDAATGILSTFAGTGEGGFSGDGGAATSARLNYPAAVAVDDLGNLIIADQYNHRIRRVAAGTGVISTLAGTGERGSSGDDGEAIAAQLGYPEGVAVDGTGNVYIADYFNHRVRRVDAGTGVITTVAGNGESGFSGDGGDAIAAQLASPVRIALDAAGNLLISDNQNYRIRRVESGTGLISTVAGTGAWEFSGDGGAATDARIREPLGIAVANDGAIYFTGGDFLRRIDPLTTIISTVAGVVAPENMGPAAQATLADPRALASAPAFTLFAGGASGTLQALRPATPMLEVVAGRYPSAAPTASLARFRDAAFGTVGSVAYDAALGRIYLTETTAHRLHVVTIVDVDDEDTWTIATLAGDAVGPGTAAFADGPALSARFDSPAGLFFDEAARVLYIADAGNHVIRTLPIDAAGSAGDVSTFAGTPRTLGIFGDGGAATDALLYAPQAVTRCDNGDVFIADTTNQRIRRVEAGAGVITTVLGDGVAASSGQGSPASTFPVDTPLGLACDPFGNLLVTSRTVVRLLVADATGVVDGTGAVQTIYGAAPRTDYPASVTSCLTGIAVVDAETVQFTDSCTGVLGELWRQPLP